jgi:hypothetical protein
MKKTAEEIAKGALRIEWRDTESQARRVAEHAEDLLADTKRTGEPLVRFCPECGGIGEVEPPARDCCPDGSAARYVPQKFAEACRATFKLAIAPAAPLGAHELLEIARSTGLRSFLHGVNATDARAILECYQLAVDAYRASMPADPTAPIAKWLFDGVKQALDATHAVCLEHGCSQGETVADWLRKQLAALDAIRKASGNDVEQHMQAIDEVMALPLLAPERGAIAGALMASFMAGQQAQRDREAATAAMTDARILEIAAPHFEVSESRYGREFNPHDQYHGSDLSTIAFARAILAASGDQPYTKHLEQRIADLHTQLHAETARLDYIEANWFDKHGADPAKGEPEGFEWAFAAEWEYVGTQSLRMAIDNEIELAKANPRDDTPVGEPVVTAADLAKVAHLPTTKFEVCGVCAQPNTCSEAGSCARKVGDL